MRAQSDAAAPAVSELLRGEALWLLDIAGDWAWVRCDHDDYVGYLPAAALRPALTPSHVVATPAALVFAAPDIKSPLVDRWPFGTRIAGSVAGAFAQTGEGYVHLRHLRMIDDAAADWIAVAESLAGTPYLWGGRSGDGLDCSGLVQQALAAAGLRAPRDSDQQRSLGHDAAGQARRRGDLVFFPGHVGIMVDDMRMIHANAHWMRVVTEPLRDVVDRLRPVHAEPVIAVRRLAA